MTIRLDREVRRGDDTHAVFTADGLAFTIGYGSLPRACPYRPGDWVRLHAHPPRNRAPGDTDQHGFRGYILGGMGGTLLRGVTDDGADWCEHYGHLLPDRPLVTNVVPCRCCPDETLRRRIERARVRARDGVQLDLFDTAGAPR